MLDRLVAGLGARLDVGVRWRGEGLDRLLDQAHAGLVDQVVTILGRHEWEVVVEASFAISGERGSIDVLAFHPNSGTVLVIDVKSVVPDSQATLYTLDRKVRLAPKIALERGWTSRAVSRLLVVGEGTTARRRVMHLTATYDAALPIRGAAVKSWLRHPSIRSRASCSCHTQVTLAFGPPRPASNVFAVPAGPLFAANPIHSRARLADDEKAAGATPLHRSSDICVVVWRNRG
jgi:hypothetical protein